MTMEIREVPSATYRADIFIGGSAEHAREVCKEFCLSGLCVSVELCDFVYTGGCESGGKVGLINYARFPSSPDAIFAKAVGLAKFLIVKLHQSSASVVADDRTLWLTRRPEDSK